MKFSFKHVGAIQEAQVELKGLTVLGGYNDTGKSFIGKTLFSIIKAANNTEQTFVFHKLKKIERILDMLSLELRRKFNFSPRIEFFFRRNLFSVLEKLLIEFPSSELVTFFEKKLEELKNEAAKEIQYPSARRNSDFPSIEETIQSHLNLIKGVLQEEIPSEEKYKSSFDLILKSVFQGEFNSKKNQALPSEIQVFDNGTKLLDISVENEVCSSFKVLANLPFEDATFVESPTILNLSYVLGQFLYRDILGFSSISYYIIDLIRKISLAHRKAMKSENLELSNFKEEIANIINGYLYFESKSDEFFYQRKDNKKIKMLNTASGIKTLGLLQLLAMSQTVNKNTLLIIDEPEVHLHPEWQLEYAKLIVSLVKAGLFVVLTSHSPYMIEALKFYSDKEISNLTKFYVSGKESFLDVTENLEPLFSQLAIPMQKLGLEE